MKTYSYTQFATAQACPKKYEWAYVHRLVPREMGKALIYGIEFHKGVADQPTQVPSLAYTVGQMARAFFGPCNETEKEVQFVMDSSCPNVEPMTLVCRCDGLLPDSVVEYKTTSDCDPDNYQALSMSLQNKISCKVFNRDTLRLRIARKSAIRQKKAETDEEFAARYVEEYRAAPQDHFMEILVKPDLTGLHYELIALRHTLDLYNNTKIYPRNAPGACRLPGRSCPYLPLCADYDTNRVLFQEKEAPREQETPDSL